MVLLCVRPLAAADYLRAAAPYIGKTPVVIDCCGTKRVVCEACFPLAKEYGFTVYAADLWSDPAENRAFFDRMGLARDRIIPVKADAAALPFEKEFFDYE